MNLMRKRVKISFQVSFHFLNCKGIIKWNNTLTIIETCLILVYELVLFCVVFFHISSGSIQIHHYILLLPPPPQPNCSPPQNLCIYLALSSNRLTRWLNSQQSICQAGDLGLIPRSGRFHSIGNCNPHWCSCHRKSHGQKTLVGYSPQGYEELTS